MNAIISLSQIERNAIQTQANRNAQEATSAIESYRLAQDKQSEPITENRYGQSSLPKPQLKPDASNSESALLREKLYFDRF